MKHAIRRKNSTDEHLSCPTVVESAVNLPKDSSIHPHTLPSVKILICTWMEAAPRSFRPIPFE